MGYQVALSLTARRDLKEPVGYISTDSPERAIAFGQFLIDSTKRLVDFPEMGRQVPKFDDPMLREIVVRTYRIIYRVDHDDRRIEVSRFWHGARGTPEIGTA